MKKLWKEFTEIPPSSLDKTSDKVIRYIQVVLSN